MFLRTLTDEKVNEIHYRLSYEADGVAKQFFNLIEWSIWNAAGPDQTNLQTFLTKTRQLTGRIAPLIQTFEDYAEKV